MDCIVFLGTVQTSSITTALTPKIGLGENHVCTRGPSAIEILIFWHWDLSFEITAIGQICNWIFSLACIPIFNCQEKIQQQKQFNHNSEFWFDEKAASSDIHTFNFNLLICSPQFIRYRLRKNNSLKVWTFHCCKNVLEIGFAFKYWSIMRKCSGPAWGESLCCSM